MMQFDRATLGREAKELGFVRDTFEKVCRLAEVLAYFENDTLLSDTLALKGGTAINLTIFDLPRLSVDIDLDFSKNVSREEMLDQRTQIDTRIRKYMTAAGYTLGSKSKSYHALESYVYEYINAGGVKDNLKIEINYMLRCHVFPILRRTVNLPWQQEPLTVLSVDPVEVFAAKAVALINRAAARDLYDMYNLQKLDLLEGDELSKLRKTIVFYEAIASEKVPEHIGFDGIESLDGRRIKTELLPVLRKSEQFELELAKKRVREFLEDILLPENISELEFWKAFAQGEYKPELVFDDQEIIKSIAEHPMAAWKCEKNRQKRDK